MPLADGDTRSPLSCERAPMLMARRSDCSLLSNASFSALNKALTSPSVISASRLFAIAKGKTWFLS